MLDAEFVYKLKVGCNRKILKKKKILKNQKCIIVFCTYENYDMKIQILAN